MSFLGKFEHTIDAKGRLFIPARFREALGEEFVIFKAPDGCMSLYNGIEFDKMIEQAASQTESEDGREKLRQFLCASTNTTMDKQGRFTVPQDYLTYAQLKTDVVVLGGANHIEVWNKDIFTEKYPTLLAPVPGIYPVIKY